jgi:hypothetical protein
MTQRRRLATCWTPLLSMLLLAGCAADQVGAKLASQPEPRGLGTAGGDVLTFPTAEKFSIALPKATHAAGLNGAADATATVDPTTGDAEVTAEVDHTGDADGTFQMGHAIANDSNGQIDIHVKAKLRLLAAAEETPALYLPHAQVGLRLFALDDRNHVLRSVCLLEHNTESGSMQQEADRAVEFTLTLGPHRYVNVYVAGSAQASVGEEQDARARARVRVEGLTLEVRSQAAPAVKTARHVAE